MAEACVAALDRWAILRREMAERKFPVASWRVPLDAARAADQDPWRNAMRDALAGHDSNALTRLASELNLSSRPAISLRLMGRLLIWDRQGELAQQFLSRAWRVYPNDFWINIELALAMTLPPRKSDLILPYITAAVTLRPDSAMAHMRRAVNLDARSDLVSAEAEFREALRLSPDYEFAHLNLASLLALREQWNDAAVEYREAIRLNLGNAQAIRLRLAEVLARLGKPKEGDAEPGKPADRFEYWHSLGVLRLRRGDPAGGAPGVSPGQRIRRGGTDSIEGNRGRPGPGRRARADARHSGG